jgi:hypothetical protein
VCRGRRRLEGKLRALGIRNKFSGVIFFPRRMTAALRIGDREERLPLKKIWQGRQDFFSYFSVYFINKITDILIMISSDNKKVDSTCDTVRFNPKSDKLTCGLNI